MGDFMQVRLVQIFFSFAKVGALTFGGGYAMLPLLQREAVARQGWVSDGDITDYYALSQCSPGLIAVNMAVYIGYPLRGLAGALAAALGVITPSVAVILLLASLLQKYADVAVVGHAFAAIRTAVAALVLQAVYRLYKNGVVDKPTLAIFGAALALGILNPVLVFGFLNITNPVLVIVVAAVAGIVVQAKRKHKRGDGR
jgi:chromate transporter